VINKLSEQMTGSNSHWLTVLENMDKIRESLGCSGEKDFKGTKEKLCFFVTPEMIKSLQENGINLSGGQSQYGQFLKLCKQLMTGAGKFAREQRQRTGDPTSFKDLTELERVLLLEQQTAVEPLNKKIFELNAEMIACDQELLNPEKTTENLMDVLFRKREISVEVASIRSDQTTLEEGIACKFQAARNLLLERKSAAISAAAALVSASKSRVPPSTSLMSTISRAQACSNSRCSSFSSSSSSTSSSSMLLRPMTPFSVPQLEAPVAPRPGARLMSLI